MLPLEQSIHLLGLISRLFSLLLGLLQIIDIDLYVTLTSKEEDIKTAITAKYLVKPIVVLVLTNLRLCHRHGPLCSTILVIGMDYLLRNKKVLTCSRIRSPLHWTLLFLGKMYRSISSQDRCDIDTS